MSMHNLPLHERLKQLLTLMTTPMTYEQIAEVSGLAKGTARQYVDLLHDARRVHVAGWETSRHRGRRLFIGGEGEDMPKPVHEAEIKAKAFRPLDPSQLKSEFEAAMEFIDASHETVALYLFSGKVHCAKSGSVRYGKYLRAYRDCLIGVYDSGADARDVLADLKEMMVKDEPTPARKAA